MRQLFRNYLRLACILILPLLFTSYIAPTPNAVKVDTLVGSYSLSSSGSTASAFKGTIVFTTSVEFPEIGNPYATIQLDLKNDEHDKPHSMGFLISKQNWDKQLRRGKYNVPNKIHGFIKNFEGVFGFANIQEMGELPFFTEEGNIEITFVGPKLLHGALELTLVNAEGNQLQLAGEFTATRKQ